MISYLKGPYNSDGRILMYKKKTREKRTTTRFFLFSDQILIIRTFYNVNPITNVTKIEKWELTAWRCLLRKKSDCMQTMSLKARLEQRFSNSFVLEAVSAVETVTMVTPTLFGSPGRTWWNITRGIRRSMVYLTWLRAVTFLATVNKPYKTFFFYCSSKL